MRLLPAALHRTYRWRNGLGSALEIAVSPTAGEWSLSIATVDADVAFSSFPGVDRTLMALSDHGLGLRIDDRSTHLEQFEVVAFAGEQNVASAGVTAPTLDLNLMVARGQATGSLTTVRVEGTRTIDIEADIAFVVAIDWEGPTLDRFDTLVLARGDSATLVGDGTVAIAFIDLGKARREP